MSEARGGMVAKSGTEGESQSAELKSLGFRVDLEFKKEFKGFAAAEGISMTDLLKEGFALSKKKRRK